MSSDSDASYPIRRNACGASFLETSAGKGERIVLLHGIGSNAESWLPLIEASRDKHRFLAWDAPGYGTSEPIATKEPDADDYAEALRSCLDALGYDRVVLIGHSLGCLFAGRFASRWPERVLSLGFLSPALGYGIRPGDQLPDSVQSRLNALGRLGPASFAAERAARLVYAPDDNEALVERVRSAMAMVHPAGYRQAVNALALGNLLADAPGIQNPTLVAVGAQDAVTLPAGARALHAVLPHTVGLLEVPRAGHALPQQAPNFCSMLVAMLAVLGS